MIGQDILLKNIDTLVANNTFPRFSIIVGEEGFGKHEVVKYIAKKLNVQYLLFDNKMTDVRNFIDIANTQEEVFLYVLQDGDDMALQAKNAILKIIEEVPSTAYVVLLTSNINSILPTILSRGFTFVLEYYTPEQLELIAQLNHITNIKDAIQICSCPGDIVSIAEKSPQDLVQYANKIVESIPVVTLSNILKVAKTITDANYPFTFNVFCNALISVLYNKSKETSDVAKRKTYVTQSQIVSRYRHLSAGKSVNKKYLADTLIIDLWMAGE